MVKQAAKLTLLSGYWGRFYEKYGPAIIGVLLIFR